MKQFFTTCLITLLLTGWQHGMLHAQSVLASGSWYKISLQETGIYAITYDDLLALGMNPAAIQPDHIRLYGNGGGMLPEQNGDFRVDDLRENAIFVTGSSDGIFDPGDLILFYGESPHVWTYHQTNNTFTHSLNLYDDYSYYFLTTDLGPGKRIVSAEPSDTNFTYTTFRFTDHQYHDLDQRNLIRSGKIWVGEEFSEINPVIDIPFSFPDPVTTVSARVNTYAVARSSQISTMVVYRDGAKIDQFNLDSTDPQSTSVFARPKLKGSLTTLENEETVITLEFQPVTDGSQAWLNYVEVIGQRYLRFNGPQFSFRDPENIGPGQISRYWIAEAPDDIQVWDVTDPGNVKAIQGVFQGSSTGTYSFNIPTPVVKEFVAFDGSDYLPVNLIGAIENQDLHSLEPATLIIVTHPLFREKAEELATFHRTQSGMSVIVAPTNEIYHEYASGRADITGIRDFIRMLWLRAADGNKPRYILLFGDGSYDYKDRIPGNTNFIPAYQSDESFKFISTYVTDDYYGIMGDSSGTGSAGNLDLGMGRFPVTNLDQATAMVDKIKAYARKTDTTQAAWRNVMTFIADDEDSNLHMHQAEELCEIVTSKYPVFNINKIYLDAYQLVSTPSGGRYPEVNKAINEAVANGSLIVNYTGHGGEDAWSGEKVLTFPDIESWNNKNMYPIFITATCEFSRFDNPERFSAGELVIVKPEAGAVALYTTTRLALSTSNFKLDTSFFRNLMNRDEEGNYLKMGDLLRISKNNNSNNNNIRNFVLLGDPAQSIAFPEYSVLTTSINGNPLDGNSDTLLGMSKVTLTGEIRDAAGQLATGFNGTVDVKVFDKTVTYRTLANQEKSYKESFQLQHIVLADGPASVKGGLFNHSFIIPREIIPGFGFGKISYYACSETLDGNGFYDNVVIGGADPGVIPDNNGPEINLFLDSRNFRSGGLVGLNTVLLADLSDENGINHVGLGLGQEILGVLDDNWTHPVVLNPWYSPSLGDYESGSVTYPISDLSPGRHTLTLRAWDMFGNSSEKTVVFFAFDDPAILVSEVYAFPNPMTDGTTFTFKPDVTDSDLKVQIEVYTITGQPVSLLEIPVIGNHGQPVQVYWDGTTFTGRKLTGGIYPFTVKFNGSDGSFAQTSGKLIIL